MRLVGWLEWSNRISGRSSQNIRKRKDNLSVLAQLITSERSDARVSGSRTLQWPAESARVRSL